MPATDLSLLFSPRSIAVVGASDNLAKLGGQVIARLATGFAGALYPINSSRGEIAGRPALPSLAALSEPIDLLIALAPGAALVEIVEQCAPGKVRFLLAIPSGFAEVPGEGTALQDRLAAAARRAGMRVVGPNCVGLLNGTTGLNASIIPLMPPGAGRGLGIITQSGGFGMATAMYAADSGMSVSRFCDVGNTIDLPAADFIDYLADDPDTEVIGAFIESVHDPQAFGTALARAAARKPVLLCRLARTPAGHQASLAHVGIVPDGDTLARHIPASVTSVESGQDLLHLAKALLWTSAPPRGRRVAIVTGTGGIGAEMADLAFERGLSVPLFSDRLQSLLRRHLPPYAATANPVDLTPVWNDYPWIYPAIVEDIAASGEADLVIASITDVPTTLPDLALQLGARARAGFGLPLVVFWGSRDADLAKMAPLQAAHIPCYRSTRDLVQVAAGLAVVAGRLG